MQTSATLKTLAETGATGRENIKSAWMTVGLQRAPTLSIDSLSGKKPPHTKWLEAGEQLYLQAWSSLDAKFRSKSVVWNVL